LRRSVGALWRIWKRKGRLLMGLIVRVGSEIGVFVLLVRLT
jgi:hypothetical protein